MEAGKEKILKIRNVFNALAVTGLICVFGASAHAQATRTWISGVGDDANPCSRTAPGKTIAGAISKTAAGGEIDMLDPGGFGTITITKAITIDGGGGQVASILASGTTGVTINAGPNDIVILRNLTINGTVNTSLPGTTGVRFLAGKQLIIENCKIFGFSGDAVQVSTSTNALVSIKNSDISNCAVGVRAASTNAATSITLDSVKFDGMASAILAYSGVTQLTECTITHSTSYGLQGAGGTISASKSLISNCLVPVQSGNGSTIRLSDNDIYDNTYGLALAGTGKILSAANNRLSGNGVSAAPTGPITVQ